MRIAHVITALDMGGAEMMLKKVISETSRSCDHVVISLKTVGTVGRSLRGMGVPVIALGGTSGRFSPFLLIRLVMQLRALKPDLVQAWMYHANLAAWIAKILSRAKWPLYWSVRGAIGEPDPTKWATRLVRKICALLNGPVACIIYNSQLARLQHEKIGYPAVKGVVIPNGFDTERFKPNPEARRAIRQRYGVADNQVLIGHVARARPWKDQRNLLSAALEVEAQVQNAVFILAGPGIPQLADTGSETADLIKALGEKLILLPEQENVNELMAAFDAFVLSSAFGEGFPNVLGEAQSCGTPCVTTDVGDCAAIVGETGLVVPPREADLLASAILKLLRMPEGERKELGLKARRRMQQDYSLARIAGMYAGCWREAEKAREASSPCVA
jgi:glycosyltransferase involved in cell wall biosynthesis